MVTELFAYEGFKVKTNFEQTLLHFISTWQARESENLVGNLEGFIKYVADIPFPFIILGSVILFFSSISWLVRWCVRPEPVPEKL